MAQHSFLKSVGGVLIPATPDSKEYVQRLKLGAILYADFRQARNPKFHRLYFSLLNLGFEYWTPTGGAISPSERELVRGYVRFLAYYAGSADALQVAADEYLTNVAQHRAANVSAAKSFDAFRRWVTIESGHYETFVMPDGTEHREPRSVSFAKMDEEEFHALYKATLDVLWTYVLNRSFLTQQEAENAAAQLLEYAA